MSNLRRPDDKNVADALNNINKRLDALEIKSDSEVSVKENGYVELAGGLIIQWGNTPGPTAPTATGSITFHKPFARACLNFSMTPLHESLTTMALTLSSLPTNTKADYKMLTEADEIFWIAIGY